MKFLTFLSLFTAFQLSNPAKASDFIRADQFVGQFARGAYDYTAQGIGTQRGYISVFNLNRELVQTLLPSQFALSEINGSQSLYPVIVLWGEMSNSRATFGIPIPYGLTYHEWQFYIPGVYRKGEPNVLRTYVPRMFVDAFSPEYLGRRFFYKKIQLGSMPFDINKGMNLEDWGAMRVVAQENASYPMATYASQSPSWPSILTFLTLTDIMGEQGDVSPRCSGFAWTYTNSSIIRRSQVAMQINRPLVEGMDPRLIGTTFTSVASYEVSAWDFHVPYFYDACP